MNNDEIPEYNKLNITDLVDCVRTIKLNCDQARFELYSYKLNDLLVKYENLIEIRNDTQALLFEMLEEINEDGLTTIK